MLIDCPATGLTGIAIVNAASGRATESQAASADAAARKRTLARNSRIARQVRRVLVCRKGVFRRLADGSVALRGAKRTEQTRRSSACSAPRVLPVHLPHHRALDDLAHAQDAHLGSDRAPGGAGRGREVRRLSRIDAQAIDSKPLLVPKKERTLWSELACWSVCTRSLARRGKSRNSSPGPSRPPRARARPRSGLRSVSARRSSASSMPFPTSRAARRTSRARSPLR